MLAITVNDAARTEADLDMNLGGLLKNSEDIFISQVTTLALLFSAPFLILPLYIFFFHCHAVVCIQMSRFLQIGATAAHSFSACQIITLSEQYMV